jgi:endonuclease/exonuclease/phosphatase (EEP) superfamily protein YafD
MVWVTIAISILCATATALPFLRLPYGIFRALEFPRMQLAAIAAIFLAIALWAVPLEGVYPLTHAALVATIIVQLIHIVRFTPLWPKRVQAYDGDPPDAPIVRIFVSNVKQSNRNYDQLLALVRRLDPDIAMFMETDEHWVEALKPLTGDYEFKIQQPQDNAYGMFMVSRFALQDKKVRFLINDDVPSFDTIVHVNSGRRFRLFAVHPEPPMIYRETAQQAGEILLVGELARAESMPVVVAGDLNDVAWSPLTRRFLRISRLLDPREGRGLFSTFHARYAFLRWPLDHMFHSKQFRLVSIKRMPFIGSDHFPILFELALTRTSEGKMEPADFEDLKRADQVIQRGMEIDRPPVGHDWEK